jgi:hypothetical protein
MKHEEVEPPVMVMVVGEDAAEDDLEDKVRRELPKHHRCSAHALILMATTDVSKVNV